jgi:FSR family fosmidomycin resistance protein-like MFS transporter
MAAWPLIRSDLGLSYVEVGLLLAVPQMFASILEPPLGLLGDAWDRRALVRGGGLAFATGLLLVAASGGFGSLLAALLLVFPASGAFVSLSQATLMDADPRRHEVNMARWVLAGSLGVVAGPLMLTVMGKAGLGWRATIVSVAAVGLLSLALVWRMPMQAAARRAGASVGRALAEAGRGALSALRRRDVLRWLTLIHFADLMLDVLLGFLALYYVDLMGASGAGAAFAVLVFTGIGLLGDALVIPVLRRVDGVRYLKATGCAILVVYPTFLLVGDSQVKLALLASVALLTSGWYSVLKGRLYSEMPGQSATVMALDSASGLAGGLLPLAVGIVAQGYGLGTAMWLLAAAPIALLVGLPRRSSPPLP